MTTPEDHGAVVAAGVARLIEQVAALPSDGKFDWSNLLATLLEVIDWPLGHIYSIDLITQDAQALASQNLHETNINQPVIAPSLSSVWTTHISKTDRSGDLLLTPQSYYSTLLNSGISSYGIIHTQALSSHRIVGGVLAWSPQRAVALFLGSTADQDALTKCQERLFEVIISTVASFLRKREILRQRETEQELLASVQSSWSLPTFLVNGRAHVVARNLAGLELLNTAGVLRINAGKLVAATKAETMKLWQYVTRATTSFSHLDSVALACPLYTQDRRFAAMVSPVYMQGPTPIQEEPLASILVTELDRYKATIAKGTLEMLFGLTSAEEKVAMLMAAGHAPNEVALRTDLAMPTVRSHLSKIFQKTNTTTQRELVRLLSSLEPFGRWTVSGDHPSVPAIGGQATSPAPARSAPLNWDDEV